MSIAASCALSRLGARLDLVYVTGTIAFVQSHFDPQGHFIDFYLARLLRSVSIPSFLR